MDKRLNTARSPLQLPDPSRTHVLWGLSKDFGLAGFRMGFIHSHNKDLIRCLDGMNLYTSGSVHIQQVKTWTQRPTGPVGHRKLEINLTFRYR